MQVAANSKDNQQASAAPSGAANWHLKLFSKSVLKQAKLARISELIQETAGKTCLDLGSDNGVISYYLRELGGTWYSADLTEDVVDSIRSLVQDRVNLVDGRSFPYADAQFDLVVVVDMIEHLEDDRLFVSEMHRVLKPGGVLIINAPNLRRFSLLRAFRNFIGQTDEAHGHLRPGYGIAEIKAVTAGKFKLESSKSYSRFFAELIDTLIVFAYGLISGKSKHQPREEVSKGLVITAEDMKKYEKNFKLYSMIYPVVWLVSRLDYLIFFLPGFMRISKLQKLSN